MEKPSWLKHKGYLHLTPQIDIVRREKEIISKVTNPDFVAKHAFYPLIHSIIAERKYKRIPETNKRGHSYKNKEGNFVSTTKKRPLHYSSHLDALIFSYYADTLQKKYEDYLSKKPQLSESIIAYRRIPTGFDEKNKSTIHFAKEVFDEIKSRRESGCAVLMFDIKNFFPSLDHKLLEHAWEKIISVDVLPSDHKNVLRASCKFSYILLDELRQKRTGGKRSGYDEKKLDLIRKSGKHCFFASPKEFRNAVKEKRITIYRFPFMKNGIPVGIPQGLPISAILANLYMLEFDQKVVDFLRQRNGFYRRYSDDIIVVCDVNSSNTIKEFINNSIIERKLDISKDKTEEYIFRFEQIGKKTKYTSIKTTKVDDRIIYKIGVPVTYLGFEYYGEKILIKSSNLAKFYRRMKHSVKSKAAIALKQSLKTPDGKYAIYRRQLHRLYTLLHLRSTKVRTSITRLVKTDKGHYELKSIKIHKPIKSNYLSYASRASHIMEDESIRRQIRNHYKIFYQTINKRLKKTKEKYW